MSTIKPSSQIHQTQVEQRLLESLSSYPQLGIVIAYSGGVDSQVLLHALAKLKNSHQIKNPIIVCHVNHGLSDNALLWQEFALQQCNSLALILKICPVNVKKQAQISIEAAARDARYQALQQVANELTKTTLASQSIIVTGHHLDDQSETFLLALKRGAGIKGLAAMTKTTFLAEHLLIRPLLDISRQTIVDYANSYQLDWVEDESNGDERFDRNFLRHKIMPLLNARWPSINQAVARSAEHCQSAQQLLDELAQQDLSLCQYQSDAVEPSLSLVELQLLSVARFNNVIRYFLACQHCLMPSTVQLKQIHQQLFAKNDKNPEIKLANHYFRRFKERVYLTPIYDDISSWQKGFELDNIDNQDLSINLPSALGKLFFSDKSTNVGLGVLDSNLLEIRVQKPLENGQISIRFSHQNPKCLPDFRQQSRSLKKVLQELNIAPWQRKRIPFLYFDNVLVAALGHFICKDFLLKKKSDKDKGTQMLVVTWNKTNNQ